MQLDLPAHFLRVSQLAAIAAARSTGTGDRHHADELATQAMRTELEKTPITGRIVIGEGERDEAPMLFIGEQVGSCAPGTPEVDIAVDPLEGTNLCATGAPNATAVIAAATKGGLLNAPDVYMDKIVAGPSAKGRLDINAGTAEHLKVIAESLNRRVKDLLVVILERPRHEGLIEQVRSAGARIELVTDGDLAPGIAASLRGTGVHAVIGTGGAPEGVLKAAALRCLGGEIVARLKPAKPGDEERIKAAGFDDPARVFHTEDLAPADDIVFCATGVTSGSLLQGVRFFGGGCRTHSLVMTSKSPRTVRFVDEIHLEDDYSGRLRL